MYRDRHRACRIARIRKDVMAADDPIDNESCPLEGANDRGAVRYRESPARHG